MTAVALLDGDYHVDRPRMPASRMANGLGMAWARTPAPLIMAPAWLALRKEGAETFLRLLLNAKARQTRGHLNRGLCAVRRRSVGDVANQRLGFDQSARRAFQDRLRDAMTGRIERVSGHHFMGQPHFLQGRCAHRFRG